VNGHGRFRRLTAPTDVEPGRVAVSLTLPAHWEDRCAPDVLLAAASPTPPVDPAVSRRPFRANVVVCAATTDPPADVAEMADAARGRLRAQPRCELVKDAAVTVDDRSGRVLYAVFSHPELGTLIQVILVLLVPMDAVVHVIEITGTLGGDRVDHDLRQVDAVMRSVRIGPPPPETSDS
jgi:hypothetical protein